MTNWTTQDWLDRLAAATAGTTCRTDAMPTDLQSASERACETLRATKAANGFVWWVGNGGSASLCGHFAQDLLNKMRIRSAALSDSALLTCMANDHGYEQVYSRPLDVLIGPSDTLVAISSSGKSANILKAVDVASEAGSSVIAFSGMGPENPLALRPVAASFHLASSIYGIIEIGHSALIHAIIDRLYIDADPELGPGA